MDGLDKHVRFLSGSPQFRILESTDEHAPIYRLYSQNDLLNDLSGIEVCYPQLVGTIQLSGVRRHIKKYIWSF